jgi:hypothetical protein
MISHGGQKLLTKRSSQQVVIFRSSGSGSNTRYASYENAKRRPRHAGAIYNSRLRKDVIMREIAQGEGAY